MNLSYKNKLVNHKSSLFQRTNFLTVQVFQSEFMTNLAWRSAEAISLSCKLHSVHVNIVGLTLQQTFCYFVDIATI